METKFTKLNAIRDELAEEYGPLVDIVFISGWDAAMERVKPLVEALEDYAELMPDDNILHLIAREKKVLISTGDSSLEELYIGGQRAREALAKFYGDT